MIGHKSRFPSTSEGDLLLRGIIRCHRCHTVGANVIGGHCIGVIVIGVIVVTMHAHSSHARTCNCLNERSVNDVLGFGHWRTDPPVFSPFSSSSSAACGVRARWDCTNLLGSSCWYRMVCGVDIMIMHACWLAISLERASCTYLPGASYVPHARREHFVLGGGLLLIAVHPRALLFHLTWGCRAWCLRLHHSRACNYGCCAGCIIGLFYVSHTALRHASALLS
jgi:hypothetical protein